jgi:hypothetical protein
MGERVDGIHKFTKELGDLLYLDYRWLLVSERRRDWLQGDLLTVFSIQERELLRRGSAQVSQKLMCWRQACCC